MSFVGRDDLILWVRATLAERSVVLVGPRRVGKSRLLEKMSEDGSRGPFFVIDLQGARTLEEGLGRILARVAPANAAKNLLSRVDKVEVAGVGLGVSGAPRVDPWERLQDALIAIPVVEDQRITVALDEVPWWLDEVEDRGVGAARAVLANLRFLASAKALRHVRWVLTGSVGLAGRAIQWDAAAELNHLDVIVVPPLAAAGGRTLFEMVCTDGGRDCIGEAAALAHDLAGGLPHWIRLIAERARSRVAEGSKVERVVVEQVIDELLSVHMRHIFAEEGQGHLARRYPQGERRVADAVLTELAKGSDRVDRRGLVTAVAATTRQPPEVVQRVVLRLIDEFYLAEAGPGDLRFMVPLFGRWWRAWGAS